MKTKIVWLRWFYTEYKGKAARDTGPVFEKGRALALVGYRFRTRVIGGWESRYAAVVTADAEIRVGKSGYALEKSLTGYLPTSYETNESSAMARARVKQAKIERCGE